MITIIRSIIVAFSLYSKIPMPIFEWKKEDMKYAIAMLPLVGVVIAAVEFAILYVLDIYNAPLFIRTCVWAVIPLLLTGGFHVDGYMDVQDALKSYKPAEEKLRILKDPHIGAFSVISFVTFGLIYMAVSACLIEYIGGKDPQEATSLMVFMSLGFVFARILCVIISVSFKHARTEGMLHE